ncbi:MAG TPA: lysylphosphatidylglycerol synthase transmembrane domain-containing protein [Candidatus Acidoferrales bacterium]|nr:lysylphosphatidylglycerol synthase transmembrane domain-containing protein [Candidatus Acidoferrales bacterium]
MSRGLRIGVSVAVSAACLYFAARGVEWNQALSAMASAHYFFVVPMLLLTFLTLYIRAQRWRVLLRPLGNPHMSSLIAATNIGFMANMVLPLRMGEVIRPVLLSRKENKPLGGILATIVLERVFDLLTVLLLFGASAAAVGFSPSIQQWGYRLCYVAVLLTGGVLFVRWQESLALRLLQTMLRPLPSGVAEPVEHFFRGFVQALEILDSPLTFLTLVGWSLYLWAAITSVFTFGMMAFELPAPLIVGSVVITTITAIVISAPSAPGFIGAFQFGCTLALGIFGVAESRAFAFSIVVHITQFVGTIAAGVYSLTREGLSLRQLEEVSTTDATAA